MAAFLATAYGPPWDSMEGSGVTSTGVNLTHGQLPVIAVDPHVIPYGSIVRVANSPLGRNRLFVAADTGGAIRGNHIDFFVASGRSAQNGWGARTIDLQVVKRGNGPGSVQGAIQQVLHGQTLPGPSSSPTPAAQPVGTTTQTSFDQAGYQKALSSSIAGNYLNAESKANPYTAGQPKTGLVAGANPLFTSGLLTTKTPNPADFTTTTTKPVMAAQNALSGMAGQSLVNPHNGYVNPIPGFTLGRTDAGVDASARPGSPIRALGDSKLVQILPNWYSGQPLYLFQLLSGPNKGQFWYVAEQVRSPMRVGQVARAGAVIGRFASSGTGIEIGWGSPSSNSRTLQGQTSPGIGDHAAAAGNSFRHLLGSLGAR